MYDLMGRLELCGERGDYTGGLGLSLIWSLRSREPAVTSVRQAGAGDTVGGPWSPSAVRGPPHPDHTPPGPACAPPHANAPASRPWKQTDAARLSCQWDTTGGSFIAAESSRQGPWGTKAFLSSVIWGSLWPPPSFWGVVRLSWATGSCLTDAIKFSSSAIVARQFQRRNNPCLICVF